jgi:hypothetical protein
MPIYLHMVCGYFLTIRTELSSFNRVRMMHKIKNSYDMTLFRKCLWPLPLSDRKVNAFFPLTLPPSSHLTMSGDIWSCHK